MELSKGPVNFCNRNVKVVCPGYLYTSFRCVGYLVFDTFRRFMDGDVLFGSVRPYIGLENFFLFLFLSSSTWRDIGNRNYPTHLKIGANVYILCEIRCLVFDVQCSNRACTSIFKYISMRKGAMEAPVTRILSIIFCLENVCTLPKLRVCRSMQKNCKI